MPIWGELSLTLLGDAQRRNRGQVRDVEKGELEMSPDFYQTRWFWVAGTMLQNVQGLILKIHAVVMQMPREEPTRQALEKLLDHADEVLAESSHQVRRLRDKTFIE